VKGRLLALLPKHAVEKHHVKVRIEQPPLKIPTSTVIVRYPHAAALLR